MARACRPHRHQCPHPHHGPRAIRGPRRSPFAAATIVAVGDHASIARPRRAGDQNRSMPAATRSCLASSKRTCICSPAQPNSSICNYSACHGFDALSSAVRAYAAKRPDAKLLQAQGADYTILSADERVTRHHLDRIIADRPFAMSAPDHHTMWANTRALELAGLINGKTLGPGNEIVMGADGLAEGELREGEAFGPLARAGRRKPRCGWAWRPAASPIPSPRRRNRRMTAPS